MRGGWLEREKAGALGTLVEHWGSNFDDRNELINVPKEKVCDSA